MLHDKLKEYVTINERNWTLNAFILLGFSMRDQGKFTLDCHAVPPHDTVLTDQQTFEERHKSQPATLVDFLTYMSKQEKSMINTLW